MDRHRHSILDELDSLIDQVIKLKMKYNNVGYNKYNQLFYKDLEHLITDFKFGRNNLSDQFLIQDNEPIHNLVAQLINEQNNLNIGADSYSEDIKTEMNRIDLFLSVPEIPDDEINRLLDRRYELMTSNVLRFNRAN